MRLIEKKRAKAYFELCKPRITLLILITTVVGYSLGSRGHWQLYPLLMLICGTGLSCAGSGALNIYLERDVDSLMRRTCRRPIQRGVVPPEDALAVGITLVFAGTVLLCSSLNMLCGFVALLTSFMYVLVYTPLKRITWLNTLVGAIPGALPPVGGWAGATGSIELGAVVLFMLMFVWQHPHFYAIAWMCREDYAAAGFKMLPVVEPDGESTFRQILHYSAALIAVSLLPVWLGVAGIWYALGALGLGLYVFHAGFRLRITGDYHHAKMLLKATVYYLPLVFGLLVGTAHF